jgi:hypothetical protein
MRIQDLVSDLSSIGYSGSTSLAISLGRYVAVPNFLAAVGSPLAAWKSS